ncbi:TPA: tetratricopeptide repeat protein, partial [bacterium]|nr:tetratricopeptide repeat protein [bacterium]
MRHINQKSMSKKTDLGVILCIYKVIIIAFLLIIASNYNAVAYSTEEIQAFQKADDLRADGKVHEALLIYENLLKENPNTDLKNEILIQMASCYIQLGDEDSAIKAYLQAIAINPNSLDSANAVALMANMFTQRYRFDDLIAVAKQIIQQFPNTESSAMASYRIANSYYSRGNNTEAIKEYKDFLVQYPKSTMRLSALNRLIYLYIAENMFGEAEGVINTILSENPNNSYIQQQLAVIYRKQGRYDEALALYQKLRSFNPKDPDIYEQVGEIYYEKGEKDKAIAEWYKITENNENQYYFHQMLAGIFKSHDLYDLAVQEYQKAIDLQPLASYLYSRFAELHIIKRNYDLAIDVYISALINLPANYSERNEIIDNVLEICQIEGLRDRVISKLNEQITQKKDNLSAMVALADIYFYSNDIDKSMELYKKLAILSQDNRNILLDRAELLKRQGQFENAIKMYESALDDSTNPRMYVDILISIGQLQSELNRPDEAIESLNFAISKAKTLNDSLYSEQLISAMILLGDIYINQKHNTQASLAIYKEAENLIKYQNTMSEKMLALYLKMANCYRIMGNFDMALKALEAIQPNYRSAVTEAKIAWVQGDIFYNMGDFENAKIHYKKSAQRNFKEDWANDVLEKLAFIDEFAGGKMEDLLKTYANIERMKENGEYDKALSEYENVLKIYKSGDLIDKIKLNISELLAQKGKYNEAIENYLQLSNSNSRYAPEALFRVAHIYSQN